MWGSPSGLPPGFCPAFRVVGDVRMSGRIRLVSNLGTPGGSPAAGQKPCPTSSKWRQDFAPALPQNRYRFFEPGIDIFGRNAYTR
jgi:hypothetical protein